MSDPPSPPAPEQQPRRRRITVRPRHSAAAARAGSSRGGQRSIRVALAANIVVAGAKLAAGLITGSSALIAEAGHSAADSINEIMLGFSFYRARRPADAEHPFGHGADRFLWAFLATLSSFLLGGCLSVFLAIRALLGGSEVGNFAVAWVVLAVAFAADGLSLRQSLAQTRREAALWGQSPGAFLRATSDPTLRALVVEDAAALIGVGLAAGGILLHEFGGVADADAIASLLIGILLAGTAILLARPLADLLTGQSIPPARVDRAYAILAASPSIDEVVSIYAVHAAPEDVILAAKVHPAPGQSGDQLARALDDLDAQLREALPEIGEVFIDLTAHRSSQEPA
jgi:cation diffusion facilitator family transporter